MVGVRDGIIKIISVLMEALEEQGTRVILALKER